MRKFGLIFGNSAQFYYIFTCNCFASVGGDMTFGIYFHFNCLEHGSLLFPSLTTLSLNAFSLRRRVGHVLA